MQNIDIGSLQRGAIRPLLPAYINGTPWSFPVITTKTDVARHDHEYTTEGAPEAKPLLDDRYGMFDEVGTIAQVVLTPTQQIKAWFDEAALLLETANKTLNPEKAILAYNLYTEVQAYEHSSAADKARAKKEQTVAEKVEQDIKFKLANQKNRQPEGGADAGSAAKIDYRTPLQQIWAHDAAPGSLENGRTYQYRMRPVIFNPLFGVPGKFEDPTDAQVAFIKGPWSEATDPVTIDPTVEYFVKRGDERKNLANIEVYQWFQGVWVTDGRLKAGIGDLVVGEGRHDIPSPFEVDQVFRAPVTFSAEATIVDIDFDRSVPEYKKDRNGTRISGAKKTTAVVFADARGGLHERFESLDKGHPDRKRIKNKVFRAASGTN
jgi:hypothetical protein